MGPPCPPPGSAPGQCYIYVQHFSSVAVPSPSASECQITPVSTSFSFSEITEEDVRKKLSRLDERKATGPDMIPKNGRPCHLWQPHQTIQL